MKSAGWTRFHLKTLLLLMVCVASLLMAWRSYGDLNEATRLARRFRLGTTLEARTAAARGLGQSLLEDSETALAALRAGLRDGDPRIRLASAEALRDFFGQCPQYQTVASGPSQESTAFALLEATADRDPGVRLAAYRAIGHQGRPPSWISGPPEAFLSMLSKGTNSIDPGVREAAILALGSPHWRVKDSRAVHLKAIRDEVPSVRIAAIKGLREGNLGSDREILLALIRSLDDEDSSVRRAARDNDRVLGQKPPKEAVPLLIKALARPDADQVVVVLLTRLGPGAAPAVPALIARFQGVGSNPTSAVTWNVPRALESIGPAARPSAPLLADALRRFLRGENANAPPYATESIAQTLRSLTPDSPEVLAIARELADRIRRGDPRKPATQREIRLLGFLGPCLPESRSVAAEVVSAAGASKGEEQIALYRSLLSFLWDDRTFLAFEALLKEDPDPSIRWHFGGEVDAESRKRSGKSPIR